MSTPASRFATRTTVLASRRRVRLPGHVELAVVEAGRDDIFHRATGRHARDERPDDEPGQRRVAVGEVVDVRLAHLGGRGLAHGKPQPANPGYPISMSSSAETESVSRAKKSHDRRWKVSAASSERPQCRVTKSR